MRGSVVFLDRDRDLGAPNLGIRIDVYHWLRSGGPLDAVAALAAMVPMLHREPPDQAPADLESCASRCGAPPHVGEGDAAIPELMRRLPDDIVLAIEQPHLERLRVLGATEYATRCLEHARAVIDADVVFPDESAAAAC